MKGTHRLGFKILQGLTLMCGHATVFSLWYDEVPFNGGKGRFKSSKWRLS